MTKFSNFYVSKSNIIIVILLFALLFLTIKLILNNNKIDQLESTYIAQSKLITQTNKTLIYLYADNIQKCNNELVMNDVVLQMSPIFNLFIPNNKKTPYTDIGEHFEYTKGYLNIWSKHLTYQEANEKVVNLLHGKIVIGLSDGRGYSGNSIEFNSEYNDMFRLHGNHTTFYCKGYSDGMKETMELFQNIDKEILLVRKQYAADDHLRAEEFRAVNESDVKDRMSKITSLQAFSLIQKIINCIAPNEDNKK